MKHQVNYVYLEDGYIQSSITIESADGFRVGLVEIDSVNKIHENKLLELKRHIVELALAHSQTVD